LTDLRSLISGPWRKGEIEIYKGFTTVHFESLFTLDCNNKGTRGHLAKLNKPGCQKDVRT